MLHILTIAIRQITHAFALPIKNSQILIFIRITFQKRRKFGYFFRFPSFCFLEEKHLDFLSCFIIRKCKYSFSFLVALFFSCSIFFFSFLFRKCRVTPHRICRDSLTLISKNEMQMLSKGTRIYFHMIS